MTKRRVHGKPRRHWSAQDDAFLRGRYAGTRTTAIAVALGRTLPSVYSRARILGLEKSKAYLASPEACRLRRGDNVGARYRYPKGHVPANKGLRRPGFAAGRMRETQFKKGQRSGQAARHWMPIGSERLMDGYRYTKVCDHRSVPYMINWKPTHVLLWEKHHGPVPNGHVLKFVNGDRSDIRLHNLKLISRRELMARNTVHNLPKPVVEAVQLIGALQRKINRRTRHDEEQNRRPA